MTASCIVCVLYVCVLKAFTIFCGLGITNCVCVCVCVLKAFTIFCGLGITNCLLYDDKARSAARQAVALEVLIIIIIIITIMLWFADR